VFRLMLFFLVALALTACLPVEASPTPVPPTETVTVTLLPSATIIWFPATPTFTPFPTQEITPTLDLRPAMSGVILEDRFDDPQSWATSRTAVGSVAFGQNELTLAVASPRGSLLSLRKAPQLDDFYLEIDALPSLCRTDDNYGLLLRATSLYDYYRLLVNCNGQLRMERLKNGKPVVLQDWVTSGQVFPGGMIRLRLGVWAQKDEMRVFVNGIYQFTAHDPVWASGQLGVFARSTGDTPLTVNFSQLKIYHLDSSVAVPAVTTPTPSLKQSKIPPTPTR
jgi:hypothetical protein